jgi:hypothetical protein
MNGKITLSPLALDIATQMNAGKSLEQIRAQRPDLTDEHIVAFMKEMFELIGLAPQATTVATDLIRSGGKRDREFNQRHCFVLRVVLNDVKPQVWRRFVVPASITLDRLHDCLQVVMGWTDSHLHSFTIAGQEFTENPEQPDQGIEETGVVLGMLIRKPRSKFTYLYDFGDGWMHTITVQSVEQIPDGHVARITCLAGKHRCPPEDVGGPWGYSGFLEAIADPNHEEHQSYLHWCGGSFDPKEFDVDAVNLELAKADRWSRRRA